MANQEKTRIFFLLLLIASGLFLGHPVKAQDSNLSHLGAYGLTSTYCGSEPIPKDVTNIPWIGCFSLSEGHSAMGTFLTHHVEVAVDANGQESFTVDGTLVTDIPASQGHHPKTNLPFVQTVSSGYGFCQDAADTFSFCPSHITIFSRNADKSVLFMVLECFPGKNTVCVSTQKNWDYEKSRQH